MEISNYLKNKAEKLESIMVNEITKQKKLLNYDDIKEYKDELLDIQKYINELVYKLKKPEEPIKKQEEPIKKQEVPIKKQEVPIKKQEEPIKKKVVESEDESDTGFEDEKENEKKDKYYLSAKKRRPQAFESAIEYEAKILRENKITHEEHDKSQKILRELIEKTKKENKYQSDYTISLPKEGDVIRHGDKYYTIKQIDEKKNKIISYQITRNKIGTLVADYPYYQNTTTYYLYNKDEYVINEKNKLELPIIQTRGKSKGQPIEYCYIKNTGKFVDDVSSYTD
jgi:hypothetical protein